MTPGGTAAFHTLGCKLNFSETSTIARDLGEAGYARVGIDDAPDVVVINTCSVTEQADAKCRNAVRRALNSNPEAFIAVIGCYAQLKSSLVIPARVMINAWMGRPISLVPISMRHASSQPPASSSKTARVSPQVGVRLSSATISGSDAWCCWPKLASTNRSMVHKKTS